MDLLSASQITYESKFLPFHFFLLVLGIDSAFSVFVVGWENLVHRTIVVVVVVIWLLWYWKPRHLWQAIERVDCCDVDSLSAATESWILVPGTGMRRVLSLTSSST